MFRTLRLVVFASAAVAFGVAALVDVGVAWASVANSWGLRSPYP